MTNQATDQDVVKAVVAALTDDINTNVPFYERGMIPASAVAQLADIAVQTGPDVQAVYLAFNVAIKADVPAFEAAMIPDEAVRQLATVAVQAIKASS